MGFNINLIQSIVVLIGLVALGMFLRSSGILDQKHSSIFARLVTNVTLPALIFTALSTSYIGRDQALLAIVMMSTEIICILLAWIIANKLNLSRPQKGAFILVSGFGSSAFLGFALIKEVFPDNAEALFDAVIISELGVGTLIYTVGIMIAMYFGSGNVSAKEHFAAVLKFFRSPIFISLVLGLLYPLFSLPSDNVIIATIYKILDTLKDANTMLVAIAIGVLLRFQNFRSVLPIVLAACVIKLIFQPFLVSIPVHLFSSPVLLKKVLILEAAMPSASLVAIFANRYGCDDQLATIVVFVSTVCSIVTIAGVFLMVG